MEELIPILAIIGLFGSIITFIYMRYKSRHVQRLALIESGQNAEIFDEKRLDNKDTALKYGLLLTFAGIGFFMGLIVEEVARIEDGLGVLPMTFIGGGLGLILFYIIMSKKEMD